MSKDIISNLLPQIHRDDPIAIVTLSADSTQFILRDLERGLNSEIASAFAERIWKRLINGALIDNDALIWVHFELKKLRTSEVTADDLVLVGDKFSKKLILSYSGQKREIDYSFGDHWRNYKYDWGKIVEPISEIFLEVLFS